MVKYGWRDVEIVDGKYLEDLKRKAKAFDRIAEVHSDNDLYSDEYVLETIQGQIDKLERADDER